MIHSPTRLRSALLLSPLVLALSLAAPASAQTQSVERLLRPLPPDSNVLAIVHVHQILKSPRATSDDWQNNPEKNILTSAGTIPAWVDQFVLGMHVHPGPIDDVTTVAIVPVPQGIGLEQVAEREAALTGAPPADIETLAGHRVLRSYRGPYFAELEPGLIGAIRPGVRQDVSRWVRHLKERETPVISAFLQSSAQAPADILLAMDLVDLPEPQNVRDRVALYLPKNAPTSRIDRLTDLIVGIQGVTLRVGIRETLEAEIELAFADSVAGHSQHVADLFREVLAEHGLALEELDKPKVDAAGNSVTLSFEMSDESLRHVLTLLSGPRPADIGTVTETTPSRTQVDVAASRKYWNLVNKSLDDLERLLKRNANVAKVAGWHDSHAKKIENLSIAGVDPMLIDYGMNTASKLRTLAASLRGMAVEVNATGQTLTYEVYGDPGALDFGWGYGFGYRPPTVQFQSNLQEVREKQAVQIQEGQQQRDQIWDIIRNDRTELEKELRKEYGVDF